MTDSLANVVIPYARFLECQERRRSLAEVTSRDRPPTIDAALVCVPADTTSAQTVNGNQGWSSTPRFPAVNPSPDRELASPTHCFNGS